MISVSYLIFSQSAYYVHFFRDLDFQNTSRGIGGKFFNSLKGQYMFKKLFFTAILSCFALSANAQIATPSLDPGFHSYGGGAAGWHYSTNVSLVGLSATGEFSMEGEASVEGELKAGLPAEGPEESASSIPYLMASIRTEMLGGEVYTNLGEGLKTDMEFDPLENMWDEWKILSEDKETRINLAYIFGEVLSVGLGYYSSKDTTKQIRNDDNAYNSELSTFHSYSSESTEEINTTGTSLTASWRISEIFFVAGGMESVKQTGNMKSEQTSSVAGSSSSEADYVENSWSNTLLGIGLMMGQPGETQYRLEYSMINSPESVKDADGDKLASSHAQTTTSIVSAEAKFSNFLFGYRNETEKEAELDDEETEAVSTLLGLGWQPEAGLTVSLYSFNKKTTTTDADSEGEYTTNGYRFFVGYNF